MTPKRPFLPPKKQAVAKRRPIDPLFEWRVPSLAAAAMLVLGCIIGAGMWRQWVWLLDNFTLMLHEAGHPLVGLLSANLMVYGGTFFQLLFPWLTKRHFEKAHNPAGVAFGFYWMAASIHNVGIYMADARAKVLPLIGGLDPEEFHDWAEILGRWGLLRYDTAMGKMLMLVAWILLIWAMWRCYQDVRSDVRGIPEENSEHINKEEALVKQFRHLRSSTESNMSHVEKKATATKPIRPGPEEGN